MVQHCIAVKVVIKLKTIPLAPTDWLLPFCSPSEELSEPTRHEHDKRGRHYKQTNIVLESSKVPAQCAQFAFVQIVQGPKRQALQPGSHTCTFLRPKIADLRFFFKPSNLGISRGPPQSQG